MTHKRKTYISLFSSAGIGCHGFNLEDFECIATNELIERRLNIQRFNGKCKHDGGYILGDITEPQIKEKLFEQIRFWEMAENIHEVDVVIATPPCQGMSVANHKKTNDEIKRNSLVIESIDIIISIRPKFFIFENVAAFMKTACTDTDGEIRTIGEAIQNHFGDQYSIFSEIINFKNHGAKSSRTRTIVIGVRNDFADYISPIELFPEFTREQTLRETIGYLPSLKIWGEFDKNDIYHNFRTYPENMRDWVSELTEGQSAFDNADPKRIPHRIENGKIIYNQNKNGDKYKRQIWDKVAPCIHTRNDQFASQNTIHPSDDRVFSIRELMLMMTVPDDFKWVDTPIEVMNAYTFAQKKALMKKEEIKIRQSLGEAVPTEVFRRIAHKMADFLEMTHLKTAAINKIIEEQNLSDLNTLLSFIEKSNGAIGFSTLCKIAELANGKRTQNAAYFTNKAIITEMMKYLPGFDCQTLRILEPSVGVGNFIPFIIRNYEHIPELTIDVVDIDPNALTIAKTLLGKLQIPNNVQINYICADFLLHNFNEEYDLVIGNPPFNKMPPKDTATNMYKLQAYNNQTTNTFSFFLEKAMVIGRYVSMITPKFLFNTPEFSLTRKLLESKRVDAILDFGEKGFEGILVETVCVNIVPAGKPGNITIVSIPLATTVVKKQSYIFDNRYPYWLIYRNEHFDRMAMQMEFDVFTVFRDRQITNGMLKPQGEIRVLKSRNINDTGTSIEDLPEYDAFIDITKASGLGVFKYLDNDDVYLTPNMTYNPRVMRKPKGYLVNGSVAILIPKNGKRLTEKQMLFFSSPEYREFYRIARNNQTRSLNIDASSVFFFGFINESAVNV